LLYILDVKTTMLQDVGVLGWAVDSFERYSWLKESGRVYRRSRIKFGRLAMQLIDAGLGHGIEYSEVEEQSRWNVVLFMHLKLRLTLC